jgi:antitoxin PrlF
MQAMAKITSKGQVTIPKAVREELGLVKGGWIIFRVVKGERADMAPVPNLLDLAGSVPVPEDVRGLPWKEIQRRAWAARGKELEEKAWEWEREHGG